MAITMDGGGKIMMDGSSGNGQRRCNERQDGKAIVMGNGIVAVQWMAQWAANNCCQHRNGSMGGDPRWMAAVITMDSRGMIVMDGGSSNWQRRQNGRQYGSVIRMGNGMAVVQLMAQWAVGIFCQCRSGTMGGNARWTAVAITMDGGGMIVMDGGSGNGQCWRNRPQDGGVITMGNGTAVARWTAQ